MHSYDDYVESLDARKPCRVCEQPSHTDVCGECVLMQNTETLVERLSPRAVMRQRRDEK
jgi:hypothetical protein